MKELARQSKGIMGRVSQIVGTKATRPCSEEKPETLEGLDASEAGTQGAGEEKSRRWLQKKGVDCLGP